MKNKGIIVYLMLLIIFICSFNVTIAEAQENEKNYVIKEVVSFDKLITADDINIKLFGITDEHFNQFINEFQQSNYSDYFNDKNIKRYLKTDRENVDLCIKSNYINKDIEEEHKNNLNQIYELVKNTPVTIEFLPNNEAIIWSKELNINEYILQHGFAAVDEEDLNVNCELIKRYYELQQDAKENEYGIWGTTFSISNVESVPYNIVPNAPFYVPLLILMGSIYVLFKLIKKNVNTKIKLLNYFWCILFWISEIIIISIIIFKYPFDYKLYWGILVIIILGIVFFYVNIINSMKNINIVYLMINSLGLVISIIISFAIIYFIVSIKEIKIKDFYYKYPTFEFSLQEIVANPYENYIHIPIDNYKIEQMNHVNEYSYKFSFIDALYFSCTTYFTVGYGDYYPCGFLRIISMIEMIVAFFLNLTVLGVAISKYFDRHNSKMILDNEFTTINNIYAEVTYIHDYIISKGFYYEKDLIINFYLSLKTKPFVILSGISGTGKSKIVELFAEAVGANYDNERFKLIPVRPDWSDATDLLGYRNIENKFVPGIIIDTAYEAMQHLDKTYFICLDEMNLARVEYYFSDILSSMETRKINDDEIITRKLLSRAQFGKDERAYDKYGDVYIPQNLYIIGTANMDESTFPFSEKVLDRANTIEFNKVDLEYNFEKVDFDGISPKNYHNDFFKSQYLKLSDCKDEKETVTKVIAKLIEINNILEKDQQQFAYRIRSEIVFYVIYAVKNELFSFDKAMDYSIIRKILPKISGSGGEVLDILVELFNALNNTKYKNDGYIDDEKIRAMEKQCESSEYKLSSQKIMYMIRRFLRDGFTTFWK